MMLLIFFKASDTSSSIFFIKFKNTVLPKIMMILKMPFLASWRATESSLWSIQLKFKSLQRFEAYGGSLRSLAIIPERAFFILIVVFGISPFLLRFKQG